jgi:hypothetical protein
MNLSVKLSFLFLAILCLTLSACGGGDSIGRTFPVKGKVLVDGKPLKQGSIVFWPKDGKGIEADGLIAEDGTYQLSTKGKPGALPGSYTVTVMAQTNVDSTAPDTAKLLVPKKYTLKQETPLTREVVENASAGAYDLDLK